MIVAGSKIYERCQDCGKLVQINKRIFGSVHICLSPGERKAKRHYNECVRRQRDFVQMVAAERKRK